jgi:hypothetical protein
VPLGDGLGDGDGDCDGVGDGGELGTSDGGAGLAACVAVTAVTVTGVPCADTRMTIRTTQAITATPTAPATATADRKLISSIRASSLARRPSPRFTR